MKHFDVAVIQKWKGKDEFISELLSNFGKRNKNDVEVGLMHLLLENGYQSESDYRISMALGIPETKVKRLKYEANIIYPRDENLLKNELFNLLINSKMKFAADKLQLAVNDKLLRNFISETLAQDKRFYDSSFNSHIITLSADDIFYLLEVYSNQEGKQYAKNIRKNIDKSKFPSTFLEKLRKGVNKIKDNYDMYKTITEVAALFTKLLYEISK